MSKEETMVKLSKVQSRLLQAAADGGVIAFGQTKLSQKVLQRRGLLTEQRDELGYFNITDAGRAMLSKAKEGTGE